MIYFTYSLSTPQTVEAFGEYLLSHMDCVHKQPHRSRIQLIKALQGGISDRTEEILLQLKNSETRITEDRIFDETLDYIHSNRLVAKVFESQFV